MSPQKLAYLVEPREWRVAVEKSRYCHHSEVLTGTSVLFREEMRQHGFILGYHFHAELCEVSVALPDTGEIRPAYVVELTFDDASKATLFKLSSKRPSL